MATGSLSEPKPAEGSVRLLVPADDVPAPELSIVIPSLNEEVTIAQFLEWCKEGPPKAQVMNIIKQELPLQQFGNFSILYF